MKDICVVTGLVRDTVCNGMLVEVIEKCSGHSWVDPDGLIHFWNDDQPTYAVVSLGSVFPEYDGGRESMYSAFSKKNLKPLRDPGDDAKDETLEWLPVPSKEKENA